MPYTTDKNLCPADHPCPLVDMCPAEAITQTGNGLPAIDADACIDCGICAQNCGKGAVIQK